MQTVRVYSTGPACMRCQMTQRALDKAGVAYQAIDLRTDQAARAYVTDELGHHEAPVVVVATGRGVVHWSGLRPDRIARLARSQGDEHEGR